MFLRSKNIALILMTSVIPIRETKQPMMNFDKPSSIELVGDGVQYLWVSWRCTELTKWDMLVLQKHECTLNQKIYFRCLIILSVLICKRKLGQADSVNPDVAPSPEGHTSDKNKRKFEFLPVGTRYSRLLFAILYSSELAVLHKKWDR